MSDYPADGPIPVAALPADLAATPGIVVVDVRDQGEWDLGHAPGAVHLPLPDLPVRFEEIDPDAQVYVICRGGGRSEQAVRYLETVGIEAAVVDGGMIAWASADRPVVRPDGTPGAV